jgi:hydrogenase/urease accessory protein HupE
VRPVRAPILIAFSLFAGAPASAHSVGAGTLEIVFDGAEARAAWECAAEIADAAVPLDADGDRVLTLRDLEAKAPALQKLVEGHVAVRVDGEPCAYAPDRVDARRGGALSVRGVFRCPRPPGRLTVAASFHRPLGEHHETYAAITVAGLLRQFVFGPATPEWALDASVGVRAVLREGFRFLILGVKHIFTGYDHLAFLLGLLLIGGGFRRVVIIVTAFTVAHSITLALAALGKFSLPSSVVEPAIALSIAYVGVENFFFVREGGARWRPLLAFFFGLVHGFGFAGVLLEMGLPRHALAASLVSFNLGVEVGQVTIVALVLAGAAGLERALRGRTLQPSRWYRPHGVRALSAGVLAAGLYWLVERTLLA